MLVVTFSRTFFGSYIHILSGYAILFVFIGFESSVLFVGLLYIYPSSSTVNKEKNLIDQRASLRVDTRETQQITRQADSPLWPSTRRPSTWLPHKHVSKPVRIKAGKGSNKTSSAPPLALLQRSQDQSWTQVEINGDWKKNPNDYDLQKDQVNTPDRRTLTTICRLCIGQYGLRKHLKRLGLTDSAHFECGSGEHIPEYIL